MKAVVYNGPQGPPAGGDGTGGCLTWPERWTDDEWPSWRPTGWSGSSWSGPGRRWTMQALAPSSSRSGAGRSSARPRSRGCRHLSRRPSDQRCVGRGLRRAAAAGRDGEPGQAAHGSRRRRTSSRDLVQSGKRVASICHGPWGFVEADVARGRRLTSWPSVRTDLRNAGAEVVDEQVVTAATSPRVAGPTTSRRSASASCRSSPRPRCPPTQEVVHDPGTGVAARLSRERGDCKQGRPTA